MDALNKVVKEVAQPHGASQTAFHSSIEDPAKSDSPATRTIRRTQISIGQNKIPLQNMHLNYDKTGNVRTNVTLRRVRLTTVAEEKQ